MLVPINHPFLPPNDLIEEKGKWFAIKQDERTYVKLVEVEIENIIQVGILQNGEKYVEGNKNLERLKRMKNFIFFDDDVFRTFWRNQHFIPEKMKEKTNGEVTHNLFCGVVVSKKDGFDYFLDLYWDGEKWNKDHVWLGCDLSSCYVAVALKVAD